VDPSLYYKSLQLVILSKFNLPFLTLQMLIAAIFSILASTATLIQTAPSGGYNYSYKTPHSNYYFQSGYSPYNRPYYSGIYDRYEPSLPASHQFHHQKIAKAPEYGNISRSFLQRQKVITSKSSSKNLSNVNKHTLCFQRIGIFIHFLSGKQQKLRFFDVFFDVIIVDR